MTLSVVLWSCIIFQWDTNQRQDKWACFHQSQYGFVYTVSPIDLIGILTKNISEKKIWKLGCLCKQSMHLLFCSKSELITTAHSLKASVSSGRDLFLENKYSGCDWGLFTGVLHYLIRSYVVLSITYEQLSYIQVSSHQEASDKWLSTSRQLNRSQSGELFNFFCWCTSKSELLVLSFCNF